MKIFQILFSFYIIVLALNPCFKLGVVSVHNNSGDIKGIADCNDGTCEETFCHPFSICHSYVIQCQIIDSIYRNLFFAQSAIEFQKLIPLTFVPEYDPLFWQPPKF